MERAGEFADAPACFHGRISREQSQQLLLGEPDGTFLLRLSNSVPEAFALDLVSDGGSFLPLLVERVPEGVRLAAVPERGIVGHTYASLQLLIDANRGWLLNPLDTAPSFDPRRDGSTRSLGSGSEQALGVEGEEEAELLMGRPAGGLGDVAMPT